MFLCPAPFLPYAALFPNLFLFYNDNHPMLLNPVLIFAYVVTAVF